MNTAVNHLAECVPGADGSCSICGDEATPAVIVTIDGATRTAKVKAASASSSAVSAQSATASTSLSTVTVALDLLDDVMVGDTVLIHFGFAIARIDNGNHA